MQSNSHILHINHNLLLHQFYNNVSFPSYLKKKKQNKTKQIKNKQTNKQTKTLAFMMSTASSIALCLGFHKPKCLLKTVLSQTEREWVPCDIFYF